jgi:hypothetical protein
VAYFYELVMLELEGRTEVTGRSENSWYDLTSLYSLCFVYRYQTLRQEAYAVSRV